jgi:hydroxyethylthiazole kinase
MMTHVVGTGCMAASVIGTFAGASPADPVAAAAAGLSCYGIAGELAARGCSGPGSFKERLHDCIFRLTKEDVDLMQNVTV